jgi:hypothetical protein
MLTAPSAIAEGQVTQWVQKYDLWDFEKPIAAICFIQEVDTGLDEKFLCLEIFKRMLKGEEVPKAISKAKKDILQFESASLTWTTAAVAAKGIELEEDE